jgi:hypothetical protein
VLKLELVVERLGIVIVDQFKGLARRQSGKALKDQAVALGRRQRANVKCVDGRHRVSPMG